MNLTETRAKALLGLGLNKKNLANRTNAQLARALNQCAGTSLPLPPMTKTILNGYEIYTAVGSPLSARQFVNLFAGKTLGPIARKVGLVPTGISKRVLKGLILKKLVDLKVPEPIRRKVATKRTRDQSVATNANANTNQSQAAPTNAANTNQSQATGNTNTNRTNQPPANGNTNRVKLNEPELNFRQNGTAEFLNRETVGNKTFVVPEVSSKVSFSKMPRGNSARNFEALNLGKKNAYSFSAGAGAGARNGAGAGINFRLPNMNFPKFGGAPKKNLKIPTFNLGVPNLNNNFLKKLESSPQLTEARRELEQTRSAAGPQNPMTQELEIKVRELEKSQLPKATGAGAGAGNGTTSQVPRGNGNGNRGQVPRGSGNGNRTTSQVPRVSGNGNRGQPPTAAGNQKLKNEANAERRRIESNAARARANLEANARRVQNNLKQQLVNVKNANKEREIQARLEKNRINLETKKAELEARTERNKAALAARVAERQANVNLRKAELMARAASASGPGLWNRVRNMVKKKPELVTRERAVEVLMEAGASRAQINEVRTTRNWRGVINRLAQGGEYRFNSPAPENVAMGYPVTPQQAVEIMQEAGAPPAQINAVQASPNPTKSFLNWTTTTKRGKELWAAFRKKAPVDNIFLVKTGLFSKKNLRDVFGLPKNERLSNQNVYLLKEMYGSRNKLMGPWKNFASLKANYEKLGRVNKVELSNRLNAIKQKLRQNSVSNDNIQKLLRNSASENEDAMLNTFNKKADEFIKNKRARDLEKSNEIKQRAASIAAVEKLIKEATTIKKVLDVGTDAYPENVRKSLYKTKQEHIKQLLSQMNLTKLKTVNWSTLPNNIVNLITARMKNLKSGNSLNTSESYKQSQVEELRSLLPKNLNAATRQKMASIEIGASTNEKLAFYKKLLENFNKKRVELTAKEENARIAKIKQGELNRKQRAASVAAYKERINTAGTLEALQKLKEHTYTGDAKENINRYVNAKMKDKLSSEINKASTVEKLEELRTNAMKHGLQREFNNKRETFNTVSELPTGPRTGTRTLQAPLLGPNARQAVIDKKTAELATKRAENIASLNTYISTFKTEYPHSRLNLTFNNTSGIERISEIKSAMMQYILKQVASAQNTKSLNKLKIPSGTKENKEAFGNAKTKRRKELYKELIQQAKSLNILTGLETNARGLNLNTIIKEQRKKLKPFGGVVEVSKNIARGNANVENAAKAAAARRVRVREGGVNLRAGGNGNTPQRPEPVVVPGPKTLNHPGAPNTKQNYEIRLKSATTVENAIKSYFNYGQGVKDGRGSLNTRIEELTKNANLNTLKTAVKTLRTAKLYQISSLIQIRLERAQQKSKLLEKIGALKLTNNFPNLGNYKNNANVKNAILIEQRKRKAHENREAQIQTAITHFIESRKQVGAQRGKPPVSIPRDNIHKYLSKLNTKLTVPHGGTLNSIVNRISKEAS